MTTTSTHSGINDTKRPSSRVLAPPGGGSSNIFGAPEEPAKSSPVTVHAGSNVFGTDKEEESPVKQATQKKDDNLPQPVADVNASKKHLPQPVADVNASKKRAFNPITGLPYGDSPEPPQNNEQVKENTDTGIRNSSRVSNPPGGRSSGPLW